MNLVVGRQMAISRWIHSIFLWSANEESGQKTNLKTHQQLSADEDMEEDKVTLAEQQEKRMKNTILVYPNIEARGRRARQNMEKGPEKEKRIRVK